jgi:hypothetical protein
MKLLGCQASLPSKKGDLYDGTTFPYLRDAVTNLRFYVVYLMCEICFTLKFCYIVK